MASANENLVEFINKGYAMLAEIDDDYSQKKQSQTYDEAVDNARYGRQIETWATQVLETLDTIFPTELEQHKFANPEIPFGAVSGDCKYQSMIRRGRYFVRGLENIRHSFPARVYGPPHSGSPLLYIEDIDSFQKVRDVNPTKVDAFLSNGFLAWSEDRVQLALEQILGVSFHRRDWGGEINDLYTANVVVSGARRASAFLLKGPGIGKKELTIADCGKNGDQIVRLFTTPAELFVVQYVGPVGDMVIKDVQGKVTELRARGANTHYAIIDGQDTARILHAYGKL